MAHVYTAADFQNDDVLDMYRELYKEIHGVKCRLPKDSINMESAAWFMNHYDVLFQQEQEREAFELRMLSEEHGVEFASWMAYYDWKESQWDAEYRAEVAAQAEALAYRTEYMRRWSPMAAAEDYLDCVERIH